MEFPRRCDMKGNGVTVTNDRITSELPPLRTADASPGTAELAEVIYPDIGRYTFPRRVGSAAVLFDAVSDQIVKINPDIFPILRRCNGSLSVRELAALALEEGLSLGEQDLLGYCRELERHKLMRLVTRRKANAARVLLINPPLPFRHEIYAFQNVYPPLGLLYLAGQMITDGHDVTLHDMSVTDMQPGAIGEWLADNGGEWDLIGISLNMTCSYERAVRLSANIRDAFPDVPVVMGGNHAAMTYEALLKDRHADFVCLGAGEHLMTKLCDALVRKTGPVDRIPGLAYWSEGAVRTTCAAPVEKIIKSTAFPAYHLIDISHYDIGNRIPIITSTGCPYDCKYCSTVKFNGRRVSYFTVDRVLSDLRRLMEMFGTNGFNFLDDSFTFNRRRMMEICDRIIEDRLDIHWTCNTRVDMVDSDMLKHMHRAGCVGIFYGIETVDQEVLNRMHKQVETDQIATAVSWAREAGIKVRQSFIVGLPGETPATLKATQDFIAQTNPEEVQLSMLTIYPGTELADAPEKFGLTIHPLKWEEHNINVPHVSTDAMDAEAIFDHYLAMRLSLATMEAKAKTEAGA